MVEPAVIFTFDDGWKTVYSAALPILSAAGAAGTAYINRYYISGEEFMVPDELDALYAAGWDIANHTYNHTSLTEATDDEIAEEVNDNKEYIDSNGWTRGSDHFAYPNGLHDTHTMEVLQSLGVYSSRTVEWAYVGDTPDLMALPCWGPEVYATTAAAIDYALANRKTMVFCLHGVVESDPTVIDVTTEWFEDIVAYCVSIGIPIKTLSEWYDEPTGWRFIPRGNGYYTPTCHAGTWLKGGQVFKS